jgi:hypothetical protein
MDTPPADINRIIEALSDCSQDFIQFWDEKGAPELASGTNPGVPLEALANLLELLYAYETGEQSLSLKELNELGHYGINLLQMLAFDAASIDYEQHQRFEDISFPLALWLARNQAELTALDPVVNTLARMANHLVHPTELENLFNQCSEIHDAISVGLIQDLEQSQPGSAWSIFLINRGIIATRTQNTDLIELAYGDIVEQLPEMAHEFFTEAMEQMELLDYPPAVREVVARFYHQTKSIQLLH